MTNQEYVDLMCKRFDEAKNTFIRKNVQYAVGDDPFANFRTSALLNSGSDGYEDMYAELKYFMAKHIAHVYNNDINGNKVDESLDDIAVYCMIALSMHELFWEEQVKLFHEA